MVADSSPARRPVLPLLLWALISRTRIPLSAFIAVVLGGILLGGSAGIVGPLQPAAAAAAAEDTAVTVDVSPTGSALLSPGQDLFVTVSITNGSDVAIDAGTIQIYLADKALTTQAALTDWLAATNESGSGDLLHSVPISAAILPGNSSTVAVTVPAASVGLTTANAWGARGIAATLDVSDATVAEGRGTFVWVTGTPVTPVDLTLAMPITTPAGSTGLIPAVALETFTSPTGLLSRQLDGVLNRPVAIAIDPMIIASIRVLGDAAPASAVAWLETLAQASNDIFPLSYADADISLEAQAGSSTLLTPISFDHAIDPARFTGSEPRATGDSSGTASPSPTPTPIVPPTTEELLAWDYTATDIGWPTEGFVAAGDLPVFTASGLTTVFLSESQVTRTDKAEAENGGALVTVGGNRGLVVDDSLSRAIRRATEAPTDEAWKSAIAEATARLAVVSAESPEQRRMLLATFDRGWPPTAERLRQTLDAIGAIPWQDPATLGQALGAEPTAEAVLEPQAIPETRLEPARMLLLRETEITGFSSAVTNPATVTAPHRLELLALYATGWSEEPGWPEAVASSLAASTEVLNSVTVTTKGPINVLATQVDIPVTLSNALDQPVTVRVELTPSNGRLVVGSDVVTTIDPESALTIKVPVSAKVGNGDVTLRVTAYSPTGVPIGQPGVVEVNVQAEWEGVGSALFAILVVAFFGFGVWRNIARRRKERMVSISPTTGGPTAGGPTGGHASPEPDVREAVPADDGTSAVGASAPEEGPPTKAASIPAPVPGADAQRG